MARLPVLRCLALAVALLGTAAATATGVPFVFDGDVDAVVHAGDATYVAGSFTHAYAPTGGGIVTSARGSGTPRPASFAHVVGEVDVVAPDGAGGWYVAGDFQTVGDQARTRLAHLQADGRVDPAWAPDPDAQVSAIAVAGDRVYVAGEFSSIGGGRTSDRVVALDRATGALTAWSAGADGLVETLVAAGDTLYLGGGFHSVGGQPRNGLAAVDAPTGAVTPFDPAPNGSVEVARMAGGTLYVAGSFTRIGGRPRKGLAALATTTGVARAWNPTPDVAPDRLVAGQHAIYVSGEFERVGGRARHGLAALDPASGRATAWTPAHTGAARVLASGPGRVYALGSFRRGAAPYRVTQLSAATGRPTGWDPAPALALRKSYKNMQLPGFAVATAAGKVFLGGAFAAAGRPLAAVAGIARLRADGSLDRTWRPRLGGCASVSCVRGIAVSATAVYLGGGFDRVGGAARPGLAAVDVASGRVTGWNPRPHGAAVPQAVAGGKVFVTGAFRFVGGQPRRSVAALDPATGAAEATWAPSVGGSVDHLVVAGTSVYLAGAFGQVDGQARPGLAVLDLATAALSAWSPVVAGTLRAVAVGTDGGVFVGGPSGLAGALARLDATTGAGVFATLFGSPVEDVAIVGDTVYVAGGDGLEAVDAATGTRRPWSPKPNYRWYEGQGRLIGQNGLAAAGTDVYAAGGFWHTATAVTGPLARLDGSSGATLPTTLASGR